MNLVDMEERGKSFSGIAAGRVIGRARHDAVFNLHCGKLHTFLSRMKLASPTLSRSAWQSPGANLKEEPRLEEQERGVLDSDKLFTLANFRLQTPETSVQILAQYQGI